MRVPLYIGAGAKSVTVTLTSVNGGIPPSGLTTSVTTTITPANCPCTVGGPLVPPGSDAFTFTTYDASDGTGNIIATASGTFTVTPGIANSQSAITLAGVPHAFAFGALPTAIAGTAFSSAQTFTLTVKDSDGNAIAGTYANPVTVTDPDASGSQGSQISINGGAYGQTVTSTASTDVFALNYGGLAIAPATLTASSTGATNGTASFAPALSAIAYTGTLNSSLQPEIDLTATSGAGSSGTFSAAEDGWTTAPFDRSFTATTSGCGSIGTVSPETGTAFTFTAVAAPVVGTCSITLTGGGGQTKTIIGAYKYGPLTSSTSSVKIGGGTYPNSATVTISETSYTGAFSVSNNCPSVTSVSTTSANGPSATFTLTYAGPGNCIVTFKDNHGGSVSIAVSGYTYPLVVSPTTVTANGSGPATVTVSETNYTGPFTVEDLCEYVTTSPSSISGPSASLTLTSAGGESGQCDVLFKDSYGNQVILSVLF